MASHEPLELRAIRQARAYSGLPEAPSIWQEPSSNGRVICGAIRRENGQALVYQYGVASDSALTVPVWRLSEPQVTRLVTQSNAAVAMSCADHGVTVPANLVSG